MTLATMHWQAPAVHLLCATMDALPYFQQTLPRAERRASHMASHPLDRSYTVLLRNEQTAAIWQVQRLRRWGLPVMNFLTSLQRP